MARHNKKVVEALAESLWWKSFRKAHGNELHLYEGKAKPEFSLVPNRRRETFRERAVRLLDVVDAAGYRVVRE